MARARGRPPPFNSLSMCAHVCRACVRDDHAPSSIGNARDARGTFVSLALCVRCLAAMRRSIYSILHGHIMVNSPELAQRERENHPHTVRHHARVANRCAYKPHTDPHSYSHISHTEKIQQWRKFNPSPELAPVLCSTRHVRV